jgi:hypothetical protein
MRKGILDKVMNMTKEEESEVGALIALFFLKLVCVLIAFHIAPLESYAHPVFRP